MRRRPIVELAPSLAMAACLLALTASVASAASNPEEIRLGDQVYQAMLDHHYLLPSTSKEAKLLAPIAKRLKAVVDPMYGASFQFYVHRSEIPNAFVVYGPRVYVDRGLIQLADNREELAGVLCHELSHALHRDGTNDDEKTTLYDERTKRLIERAEAATHHHLSGHIEQWAQFGENFIWLHHSRAQEERADLSGAALCARAGINPWGLVWMFQKFEKVMPNIKQLSFLSDHPATKKRIAALKRLFSSDPGTFSVWSNDETTATPLR